ncbi:MAG TPA: phycocyanin alpha phycocyanobilin lyase [Planctomycetaceae bacterium]
MSRTLRFLVSWAVAAVAGAVPAADPAGSAGATVAEIVLADPMEGDPGFDLPGTVKWLRPAYKPLWYQALAGPEAELRMRAAETIARARERGLDDMSDAAPHLRRALGEEGLRLPVRLAIARALILIDARDAAPDLVRQAGRGELEMRQLVEPALAEWDFGPARAVWLERLNAPETPLALLSLAVRCAGVVRETAAAGPLVSIAESDRFPSGLRLEAARALATIRSEGLEEAAGRLAPAGGTVGRLVAASMLARHSGERTSALLLDLALDPEPAVAAVALRRLLEIDPNLVVPIAGQVVRSRDATVRRLGAEALVEVPTPAGVETLEPLLDDPHPDVRAYVCDSLYRLAERPELDGPVREAGTRMLAGEGWRGLEQAAILLGGLDHEPAADRLLELLSHPRPEVMVAAAAALRRLAIPETLAPILAHAERQTARLRNEGSGVGIDAQHVQIFQMFGETVYRPADSLLREYVPRQPFFGLRSRAAAVWALGHLHDGEPDAALVPELQERLADIYTMPPEMDDVRRMSAVTLGRMKAGEALPTLREFAAPNGARGNVDAACNWAIHRMTGETFPRAEDARVTETGWFLEPIE